VFSQACFLQATHSEHFYYNPSLLPVKQIILPDMLPMKGLQKTFLSVFAAYLSAE
jgi:hypothetical protein